jgi:hypothetical protein
MQRPDAALEKEFNDNGVFFLGAKSIHDPSFDGSYLGVEVEIAVTQDSIVTVPDFTFSIVNKRGVAALMTDWTLVDDSGQRKLRFLASVRVPDDSISFMALALLPHDLAMTFMDLCFYAGNEAIPEGHQVDTETAQRPGTRLADLGWILPSRFVDTIIDALGKMNDAVLSGMLEEGILYGVRTKLVQKVSAAA